LKGIEVGSHPKEMIQVIGDDLLRVFADVPLIDKYDVYQHLMTYWETIMQDDVYALAVDGWPVAKTLRIDIKQGNKYTEAHDFELDKKRYKADIIPPELVIRQHFSDQQAAIDEQQSQANSVDQSMQELDDEHSGEDGLLASARSVKKDGSLGNVTKGALNARLKEIEDDPDEAEEVAVLHQYRDLMDKGADLNNHIKTAQEALYKAVIEKYQILTEDEIKVLLVDNKWLAALAKDIQTELDRVSQSLTGRIKHLTERYATPLPQLTKRAQTLNEKVDAHLKKMGYLW